MVHTLRKFTPDLELNKNHIKKLCHKVINLIFPFNMLKSGVNLQEQVCKINMSNKLVARQQHCLPWLLWSADWSASWFSPSVFAPWCSWSGFIFAWCWCAIYMNRITLHATACKISDNLGYTWGAIYIHRYTSTVLYIYVRVDDTLLVISNYLMCFLLVN